MGADEKHAATSHGVRHDPDLNVVRTVYAGASPVPSYDERAAAFDRMIAKVRAEAKAEALDEAAGAYPVMLRDMVSRGSVAAWLRARDNQYKEEPANGR